MNRVRIVNMVKNGSREMKTLLAAAALMVAVATPALAQPASGGSGNRDSALSAARRTAPAETRSRKQASPPAVGNTYRWPYAKYDAQGNLVGPNPVLPGRW